MKKIMFLAAALIVLGCSTDDGSVAPPEQPPVEVNLEAKDDAFTTVVNTTLEISGLMENDSVDGYARIAEHDTESEKGGSIEDNRDGTFTYTPPADFIGEDSFQYTLCDNATTPNCSTANVVITITAAQPVAVDDSYETEEEKVLTITDFTDNDQLYDNVVVTEVNGEASTGSVSLQADGDIVYTPADGFTGEDSFTYTLCDDNETPSCSTATIVITVVDEGSPVASADNMAVEVGTSLDILVSDLLANDDLTDDAQFSSVDDSATTGSVTVNGDGSITYTPASSFTGDDTFDYQICDDDQNPTCSSATVTISVVETIAFNIPPELQTYYGEITLSSDTELNRQEVVDVTVSNHTTFLSYAERHNYIYDADEDLGNPDNVILMYTGESRYWEEYSSPNNAYSPQTFNTEHVYPRSRLSSTPAENDLHHLRVADEGVNSQRSNYPFVEGSGTGGKVTSTTWYPGDEWKGDVARMVMYLNIRYGESFDKVGNLELFLQWNVEDPVSPFELQRQQVIEMAQGNRNPFIDNPYLATLIWGGPTAENRWE